MTQTTAAQRAELAGVLAQLRTGATWWGSADGARRRLLELVPLLLADAAALAERERADDEQAGDARWHSLMGRE